MPPPGALLSSTFPHRFSRSRRHYRRRCTMNPVSLVNVLSHSRFPLLSLLQRKPSVIRSDATGESPENISCRCSLAIGGTPAPSPRRLVFAWSTTLLDPCSTKVKAHISYLTRNRSRADLTYIRNLKLLINHPSAIVCLLPLKISVFFIQPQFFLYFKFFSSKLLTNMKKFLSNISIIIPIFISSLLPIRYCKTFFRRTWTFLFQRNLRVRISFVLKKIQF